MAPLDLCTDDVNNFRRWKSQSENLIVFGQSNKKGNRKKKYCVAVSQYVHSRMVSHESLIKKSTFPFLRDARMF